VVYNIGFTNIIGVEISGENPYRTWLEMVDCSPTEEGRKTNHNWDMEISMGYTLNGENTKHCETFG